MESINQHLPPLVVECPVCGEMYLLSREPNIPSQNAIIYTDGFYSDEFNWRTPEIIGCVTCELGFFPQTGKLIATPDWDEFYLKWSHLKQAQPPATGALVMEIRARKKMDLNTEKILRKEFWYSGIHTESGRSLMANNIKFKNFWLSNLERLDELTDPISIDDKLLKAEINRQLGRFDQCLEIVNQMEGRISLAIRDAAHKGIVEAIVVG